MRIQHNLPALNASRQLKINNSGVSKNLEKLSSGFRVNRAGDDAAGLAISEKMRGQIRGLSMAEQNAAHGIDLIKTAEGGLNETHAMLQRMRELAVQSSNGTYQNDVDRTQLQAEYHALKSEIDRVSQSTHYNNIKLLNGSLSKDPAVSAAAKIQSAQAAFVPYNVLAQPLAAPVAEIMPLAAPTHDYTININTMLDGTYADYTISGGVLTITGNKNFLITGTGQTSNRIVVDNDANGCNIILKNVNINTTDGAALDMRGATVKLWLEGTNTLTSSYFYAGVQTKEANLTIDGTGSLVANGGNRGAGIGGGSGETSGSITINSGTVTATGGEDAAGIGGGDSGDGGTVEITGGTVTATGGDDAAGIGGGYSGDGGEVKINGGLLEVTKGRIGAGPGSSSHGTTTMLS